MERKMLGILAVLVLSLGLATSASALTITPSDAILWGNENNTPAIEAYLDANVPGFNSGNLIGEFPAGDVSDFTITADVVPVTDPLWLVVKDGRSTPAWYLFDLDASGLNWNGTDSIILSNFWPGAEQGGISNAKIYGNSASVPEPATMLLLGFGLLGLAGVRRFKK